MLASTLAHSASEINKALSVTNKLLFILSKNIVPSRSYRYIRDRAFPVTRLPPPIYTKFDVKQRYQCAGKRTFATPKPNPNPPKPSFFQKPSFKSPKNSKTPGVLTVNIIPISHKSAKIAIFSCQKSRVPNKIET